MRFIKILSLFVLFLSFTAIANAQESEYGKFFFPKHKLIYKVDGKLPHENIVVESGKQLKDGTTYFTLSYMYGAASAPIQVEYYIVDGNMIKLAQITFKETELSFAPPKSILPLDLNVKSKWSWQGSAPADIISSQSKVAGTEKLTIGNKQYNALKVVMQNSRSDGAIYTVTSYYVENIGKVREATTVQQNKKAAKQILNIEVLPNCFGE